MTLFRQFKPFFDHPLSAIEVFKTLPINLSQKWILGVDGKWLKRNGVFMNYRNITDKVDIFWKDSKSESYETIDSDFGQMDSLIKSNQKNVNPCGAISDWKGAIVAAVKNHYPNIPHQRCLTHVTRTAKCLLPRHSRMIPVLKLRKIATKLDQINNIDDLNNWYVSMAVWLEKYDSLLKEKTIAKNTQKKWWYTHGNLRRAWRLLTKDTKPFFEYLDHPGLPRSNNSLEGVNSQFDSKLGDHRGMKHDQQIAFANWYFAFKRVKNQTDLKKLWVVWKRRYNKE
jgi:hypothetical protein